MLCLLSYQEGSRAVGRALSQASEQQLSKKLYSGFWHSVGAAEAVAVISWHIFLHLYWIPSKESRVLILALSYSCRIYIIHFYLHLSFSAPDKIIHEKLKDKEEFPCRVLGGKHPALS